MTECKLNIAITGDSENVDRTVVLNSFQKRVIVGGRKVTLNIWDTGGLSVYKAYVLDYIKKADGVALVVDVTERNSFISLITWLRDVRRVNRDSPMLIVGNKIDKLCPKQVSSNELRDFANSEGLPVIEISAKSGDNVEKVFQRLAFRILCGEIHGNNLEVTSGNTIRDRDGACAQLPLKSNIRNLTTEKPTQKSFPRLKIQSVLPDKKKFGMNFRIPFLFKLIMYLCIISLLLYYIYHLLTYNFGSFHVDIIQFIKRIQSVWHHVCEGSQACDKILSSLKTFSMNLIL
ncbi:ras-related protein Rab-1B isoform X2 [Parasteatoda tepidariorum]|uniref:ras-related protein Rab-1B isoform X2 n=1 Tax=Parasteatoda tepidariorum TaxID=114398 RepID=UPI0039BC7671